MRGGRKGTRRESQRKGIDRKRFDLARIRKYTKYILLMEDPRKKTSSESSCAHNVMTEERSERSGFGPSQSGYKKGTQDSGKPKPTKQT